MPDSTSPLNMGVPWDSLSGGTNPQFGQDLQEALVPSSRFQGPVAPGPGQAEFEQALGGMREFQATLKAHNDAAQTPPQPTSTTLERDPDGNERLTIKGPAELARYYGNAAQFYQQALGGYAKQMDSIEQQMRAQEAQIRSQPPWVQLATALSANLAQAPNMPGWVQAAGRTAAQLNPRPEELQMRRMGVLNSEAQLAERAIGAGLGSAKFALDVASENRRAAEAKVRDRLMFDKENVGAAIRGEGDPAAVTALGVQAGFVPPEQAEAYQKNIEAIRDSYATKKTADEKRTMDRQITVEMAKAGIQAEAQARLFAQQDKIVAERLAATAAENDKKIAAAEARGVAKKAELTASETKDLEQYVAADKALDEVEALLKTPDAKKYMGYASGTLARIGAKYAPETVDPNGVIAGIDSKLKLQTAQAIKSTGAGARGFGPMERPFFEGLAEGITRSPAQNQHIIDVWREYLDQSRKGVLANHTDETVQKYPKMFGPRIAGAIAEAPSAAGAPNDQAFRNAVRNLPSGKAIKANGKLYTRDASGNPVEVR